MVYKCIVASNFRYVRKRIRARHIKNKDENKDKMLRIKLKYYFENKVEHCDPEALSTSTKTTRC